MLDNLVLLGRHARVEPTSLVVGVGIEDFHVVAQHVSLCGVVIVAIDSVRGRIARRRSLSRTCASSFPSLRVGASVETNSGFCEGDVGSEVACGWGRSLRVGGLLDSVESCVGQRFQTADPECSFLLPACKDFKLVFFFKSLFR